MLSVNTKYRTDQPEIMDDFAMEGSMLRDALDKIASINQFLGGNKLTIDGLKKLLENVPEGVRVTIVDVGCGNGDMLRKVASFGEQNGRDFKLIGIDANRFTIDHARCLSTDFPMIMYQNYDIFSSEFDALQYDIVLCTLTLHHFKDDEIVNLMQQFYKSARIGIVINDLHRSAFAYRLFQIVCWIFRLNEMSREDGLISILRGFTKQEITDFSERAGFKNYTVGWKWAFRYQWIVAKI